MTEIQLYQGQLVYPSESGEMKPVPPAIAGEFMPIMEAFTQGQIAPHIYQGACDYVMRRSQELELVGSIASQAIASHQAVNVELAKTIQEMAKQRQETDTVLVYHDPNLAAVVWTGFFAVLVILGAVVSLAAVNGSKSAPNSVPVQQQYL